MVPSQRSQPVLIKDKCNVTVLSVTVPSLNFIVLQGGWKGLCFHIYFCLIQIHFLLTLSLNAVISETELFTFEFSIFPEKYGFMEQNVKAELILCWNNFLQIFMRYLYLF